MPQNIQTDFLAMVQELVGKNHHVSLNTTVAQVLEFGVWEVDFLNAVAAVEIRERVDVPNEFVDRREWTLAELVDEILRLPKVSDALWDFHIIRMVSGLREDMWIQFETEVRNRLQRPDGGKD